MEISYVITKLKHSSGTNLGILSQPASLFVRVSGARLTSITPTGDSQLTRLL